MPSLFLSRTFLRIHGLIVLSQRYFPFLLLLFFAIAGGVSSSCCAVTTAVERRKKKKKKKNRWHRFPRRFPRKSRGSRERHALLFVRKNIRLATRERAFNGTIPLKIRARVTDVGWNKKGGEERERERGDASFDVHCSPRVGCFLRGKIRGMAELV